MALVWGQGSAGQSVSASARGLVLWWAEALARGLVLWWDEALAWGWAERLGTEWVPLSGTV